MEELDRQLSELESRIENREKMIAALECEVIKLQNEYRTIAAKICCGEYNEALN